MVMRKKNNNTIPIAKADMVETSIVTRLEQAASEVVALDDEVLILIWEIYLVALVASEVVAAVQEIEFAKAMISNNLLP